MTTTPTVTNAGSEAAPAVRETFRDAVAAHAAQLQARSAAGDQSATRTIALLRRAAGTPPGSIPDILDDTVGLIPGHLAGKGPTATAYEHAAHAAMTLFGMHRQGATRNAHKVGAHPADAISTLAYRRSSRPGVESPGVRAAFNRALTGGTPARTVRELIPLVRMMQQEGIPVDYGALADDLSGLFTPARRNGVRLMWARRYSATKRRNTPTPTSTDMKD